MLNIIIKNINKFIITCYNKYYNKITIKHALSLPKFWGVYILRGDMRDIWDIGDIHVS